jgi:hypothetical protein
MENLMVMRFSRNALGIVSAVFAGHGDRALFLLYEDPKFIIPAGRYICVRGDFKTHKNVFEITGIPGHSFVLLHPGNGDEDTEGCPLPGLSIGLYWKGKDATPKFGIMGGQSKPAFDRLMKLQGDTNMFHIEFIDAFPQDVS